MSRTGKRGTLAAAGWVTFALVAGAAGVLAGRGFAADEAEQVVEAPVSHEVTVGTVGHEVRFEAQGSWPMAPLVWATQGGVVTSVDLPDSGRVEAGDQLLSVALRPVVAVPGEVPASRDLTVGTRGPDVRQLQEFLVDQEHLAVEPDGVFRDHTRRAVVAWQREVGFPADGVVRLGDVAFFAELPAWVTLSPGVAVGAGVGAGQPLMEGAIGSAVVEIVTSPEQAALLPEPKALLAQVAGHSWPGRLGVPATGADGQVRIPVESNSGGPVCGDDCALALPLGQTSTVGLEVVVVPETTGPLVPITAISTDPGGHTVVTLESGETASVTIKAAHGGMAVVEGLTAGARILVFGG